MEIKKMKIEDLAGRILLIAINYLVILAKGIYLFNQGFSLTPDYIAGVLILIFTALVVLFTITRLPPKNTARGIEPRVSAILGTFVIMGLNFLPSGDAPEWIKYIGVILTSAGLVASIYCISWLGKSFSVMATARRLVTAGPYSIVRHPLYFCENIFVAGAVISHFSIEGVVLWAVQIALQVRRMFNEEKVLRETFPEYGEYSRRVPMVIPGAVLPEIRKTSRA
jgi:protein-S-isoprenylcysteine O-methyltransferase Ste14